MAEEIKGAKGKSKETTTALQSDNLTFQITTSYKNYVSHRFRCAAVAQSEGARRAARVRLLLLLHEGRHWKK
jgi:hypothetical protein